MPTAIANKGAVRSHFEQARGDIDREAAGHFIQPSCRFFNPSLVARLNHRGHNPVSWEDGLTGMRPR